MLGYNLSDVKLFIETDYPYNNFRNQFIEV